MSILRTFAVFAKFWEKGKVKTRLARSIGDTNAAEIYFQFLRATLQIGNQWNSVERGDRRVIGFAPESTKASFRDLAPDWDLVPQVASHEGHPVDLGIKMREFFSSVFDDSKNDQTENDHRVVLIGSDSPLLTSETIDRAFDTLDESEVVIGPCTDGGYYLIGAKNQTPSIFENIEWSSEKVLEQTINQLEENQIRFELLEPHDDIDNEFDLRRMIDELEQRQSKSKVLVDLLALAKSAIGKNQP